MIYVNLLPPELRPIKRTPLPYILVLAVVILMFFVLGSRSLALLAQSTSLNNDIAAMESELVTLQPVVDEYNELSELKLSLEDKVKVIEEILEDRKIWSKHLHQLSELTPDNFWFDQIRVYVEQITENEPKIDDKTGEPVLDSQGRRVMQRVRISRPVLDVTGYVIKDEQGKDEVHPLTTSTTESEDFAAHFELDSASLEDTEFGGYRVRGFTLKYIVKEGGQN